MSTHEHEQWDREQRARLAAWHRRAELWAAVFQANTVGLAIISLAVVALAWLAS